MELENHMVVGYYEEPNEPVCECVDCGIELYNGDIAYIIDGEIYCEDCVFDKENAEEWEVDRNDYMRW